MKWLKNSKGFSMVQVMVAAGMLGGLSLMVAEITRNASKTKNHLESSMEINMTISQIQAMLQSSISCNLNFKDQPVTQSYTELRRCTNQNHETLNCNDAGQVLLEVNKPYGNGSYQVNSINTKDGSAGTVDIEISFQRLKGNNNNTYGAKEITKVINIQADRVGPNISNCYSDISNAIDTAVLNACKGNGARVITLPSGGYECTHDVDDTTTCGPGEFVEKFEVVDGETKPVCAKLSDKTQGCDLGKYATDIDADGNFICKVIPACREGEILVGKNNDLDPDKWEMECQRYRCDAGQVGMISGEGNIECINQCQAGEVLVRTMSGWKCTNTMCTDGGGNGVQEYFVGISPTGDKVCNTLLDTSNTECKHGGKLVAGSDGAIKLECCTPQCSAGPAANYCTDTFYPADNSCGMCEGSRPSQPGRLEDQSEITSPGWEGPATVTDAQWNDKWYMCAKFNTSSMAPASKTITRRKRCLPPICGGVPTCTGDYIETKICTYKKSNWVVVSSTGSWSRSLNNHVPYTYAEILLIGGGGGGRGSNKGNYARGSGGFASTPYIGAYSLGNATSCNGSVGSGGGGGGLGSAGGNGGSTTFRCGSGITRTASGGAGGSTSYGSDPGRGHGQPQPGETIRYDASDSGVYRIGAHESCRNAGPAATTPGAGGAGGCSKRQQRRGGGQGGPGYLKFRYWTVDQFQ